MKILVINAGSSTLKYQVFDMEKNEVLAKGNCEKIGLKSSFLKHKANGKEEKINQYLENHNDAINLVLESLLNKDYGVLKSLNEIQAVGHRVLHGGEIFKDSVIIDEKVLKTLYSLRELGPLHMPANILGIEACSKVMPNVPQVAVFDTAFHSKMPKKAFMYALPYEVYTEWKIRKYGFHGTSHKYVSNECAKLLNKDISKSNIITIHLGGGCSMSAIQNGISVDTTMGYTPLEGLMMGTRCGDIDASVLEVLMKKTNMSINEAITFLNKQSGIFGINGVTSDMRENDDLRNKGNERAQLAYDMFAYKIKKYIGSYMAVLGNVDAIVFTGGVGENDSELRQICLTNMENFGIELDVNKNKNVGRGTSELISSDNSKVKVYRIPTDEEKVIATDTYNLAKK